jgi:hypothetical protein
MQTIACTGQSEARGRHRWFRLATAELTTHNHGHADEVRLCLDLYSRRRGRSAPVILRLTAADATALAQALQAEVAPLTPALAVSHPCCPQCQGPQHLAYTAPWVEGTLVVQDATCHICGACWHDVYTYSGSVLHDA